MNVDVQNYVSKYNDDIKELFFKLREIILRFASCEIEEKLWAKLPSYYVKDRFVRIIPFDDHINIHASAILNHILELRDFKITPKGMLQIHMNQEIPSLVLQQIFIETLFG